MTTTGKLDATDTTMCSSAAKRSFVMSKYQLLRGADVSQGEEAEREEVEEMSSEELARVVKEQRNYIEILKTALREVLDQNDEVGISVKSQTHL